MITKAIGKIIKTKKPAIIKEHGSPRYVILDWRTYQKWQEAVEDAEDSKKLTEALLDPKNKKRMKIGDLKI
ncbi:hypothetical protein HYS99_01160 [Candidatus Giovannonibacteria bacterium]|nr:hypothetical protein [Candidatus Giovannonibacteria bacterium]